MQTKVLIKMKYAFMFVPSKSVDWRDVKIVKSIRQPNGKSQVAMHCLVRFE